MAKSKKPEKTEWIVTANIEMHGATILVEATSEEEAMALVEKGEWGEGFDTSCAEVADVTSRSAEKNI